MAHVRPSGTEVTVYPVIGSPPVDAGAIHETRALALPRVATTEVGLPGTVAGVTGAEGSEAGPVPSAFVARTVNVYGVPFARPGTVAAQVTRRAAGRAAGRGSDVVRADRAVADAPPERSRTPWPMRCRGRR